MFRRLFIEPWVSWSAASLIFRLVLGIIFFAHGAQKVLGLFGGPGLEGTVGFMGGLGITPELAYTAAFTEFFGGLFLIVGFLTRICAAGLLINMAVAIWLVHLGQGFFNPQGIEFPLSLLTIAFGILLMGPGRYSVDAQMGRPVAVEEVRQRRAA